MLDCGTGVSRQRRDRQIGRQGQMATTTGRRCLHLLMLPRALQATLVSVLCKAGVMESDGQRRDVVIQLRV